MCGKNRRITFLQGDLRGVTVADNFVMRLTRFAIAVFLAGAFTTSFAHAAPVIITFDADDPIGGLPVGTTLSTQYAAFGVTFSPNAFSGTDGPNGDWADNTDMTIVSSTGDDVGGDLGLPSLVSGNVLRSFDEWNDEPPLEDDEGGDPSFRAAFSGAGITTLSATFAGIGSQEIDAVLTRLFAYNGNTLLAVATASPGDAQQVLTVSSVMPITSVVFTPGNLFDYVAVDNITFTPVAVPEPVSLTLLALGVAAAARSRRRR